MMKKETWKPVTIGGFTGILMGVAATYGVQAAMNNEASASESDNSVPAGFDSLSFKDAFNTARAQMGPGGVFEWRGNLYNTYTEAEWNAKTHQEKVQFAEQVTPQPVEEDDDVQIASLPKDEDVEDNRLDADNMQTVNNDVTNDDDDVHVVGFGEVELPNGRTVTVEELDYNGQRVAVIDLDQDGTPDVAMSDLNGNHRADEGEVIDLHTGEALTFADETADTVAPAEDLNMYDV